MGEKRGGTSIGGFGKRGCRGRGRIGLRERWTGPGGLGRNRGGELHKLKSSWRLYLQRFKREICFVKDNITRYIDTTGGRMKTLVSFMMRTIADENTFKATTRQLVGHIITKVRET